jgi:hypothetical protein
MIIVLRADSPPRLTDADRLDRLHAEIDGELADEGHVTQYDEFVRPADDDHVWVDIDWLRTSGVAQVGDADHATKFDAMIAYAATKGWLHESGRCVKAHIARP